MAVCSGHDQRAVSGPATMAGTCSRYLKAGVKRQRSDGSSLVMSKCALYRSTAVQKKCRLALWRTCTAGRTGQHCVRMHPHYNPSPLLVEHSHVHVVMPFMAATAREPSLTLSTSRATLFVLSTVRCAAACCRTHT